MDFTGIYNYTVDAKNRLFIPSKLKKNIKKFFIAPGLENCIYLYPSESWEKIVSKFDTLNLKDKRKERAFKRAFLCNATELSADKFGRIVIPQVLNSYAKIKKDVVIVGVWNRIEIWSKESWNRYYDYAKDVVSKMSDELEI